MVRMMQCEPSKHIIMKHCDTQWQLHYSLWRQRIKTKRKQPRWLSKKTSTFCKQLTPAFIKSSLHTRFHIVLWAQGTFAALGWLSSFEFSCTICTISRIGSWKKAVVPPIGLGKNCWEMGFPKQNCMDISLCSSQGSEVNCRSTLLESFKHN